MVTPAHGASSSPRPRGLLRTVLGLPPLFYRTPLARYLGSRFLLLTTTGRTSGRPRPVALNYARDGEAVYVMSGYGRTDWLRNLEARPAVDVAIGAERWPAIATLVADAETLRRVRALFRQQAEHQGPPRALRGLLRRFGLDYDAALRTLDQPEIDLPVVALRRAPDR